MVSDNQTIKNDEFNSMIRFAFRLAVISLLMVVGIYLAGVLLPEDSAEWINLAMLALAGCNLIANLAVFYLALVGLFKSSLKWRALLSMLIALAVFALYAIALLLVT